MKQFPKSLKYKKYQKIRKKYFFSYEKKYFFPLRGLYGLQSIQSGKIKYEQIEACRKTIRRHLGKGNSL
jgi:ribosomal protein L16/L10AE